MFKLHSIKWTISRVKSPRRYNPYIMKGRFFMASRVITVMLLLFPLTAFSQNSFYTDQLRGKDALGMSLSFLDNGKIVSMDILSPLSIIAHKRFLVLALNCWIALDCGTRKHSAHTVLLCPPSPFGVVALEKTSGLLERQGFRHSYQVDLWLALERQVLSDQ